MAAAITRLSPLRGNQSANASRTPMIYVGANDGMLHAFRAEDGVEAFAYLPSSVFNRLYDLTDPNYTHRYYVDGRTQEEIGREHGLSRPTVQRLLERARWSGVVASCGINDSSPASPACEVPTETAARRPATATIATIPIIIRFICFSLDPRP